jgi:hypothetical protein
LALTGSKSKVKSQKAKIGAISCLRKYYPVKASVKQQPGYPDKLLFGVILESRISLSPDRDEESGGVVPDCVCRPTPDPSSPD